MGLLGSAVSSAAAQKAQLAALKVGKTEEQKKVIDYFMSDGTGGGCLSKGDAKDSEYDDLVKSKVASINWDEKVLTTLGIDKSQIDEVEPLITEGYYNYSNAMPGDKRDALTKIWTKTGSDGKFRSSAYQKTYIYFSSDEVFMYQAVIYMDSADTKEIAKEYYYKDITSFTTKVSTEEYISKSTSGCLSKTVNTDNVLVYQTEFEIIVPGDSFSYIIYDDGVREASIQGMKAKFREKKNS